MKKLLTSILATSALLCGLSSYAANAGTDSIIVNAKSEDFATVTFDEDEADAVALQSQDQAFNTVAEAALDYSINSNVAAQISVAVTNTSGGAVDLVWDATFDSTDTAERTHGIGTETGIVNVTATGLLETLGSSAEQDTETVTITIVTP